MALSSFALAWMCVMGLSLAHVIQAQNTPQDFLDAHNAARSQVGIGNMTWNTTVETYAQNYANQRISDCQLVHSGGPYGENLFWGLGQEYTAADAATMWVNEMQYYDYATNTCASGGTIHKLCGATRFSSVAHGSSAIAVRSSSYATIIHVETSWGSACTRVLQCVIVSVK